MTPPVAIEIALALIVQPSLARRISRMPLPAGVTALLEVATGDPLAVQAAALATLRAQPLLGDACGFFIEQVMFAEGADSYRILGCGGNEPRHQLRRHMALLLRWLHPDKLTVSTGGLRLDKTVFAHRVTQAWEDLKTVERRAAYDSRLRAGLTKGGALHARTGALPDVACARSPLHPPSGKWQRRHTLGMAFGGSENPISIRAYCFDFPRKEA